VVAVVGDPGVGKSRLFFEFTRSPAADGWLLLETAAVSYGRTLTYLPVVALLRAYFEVGDHEAAERVQAKVTERVLTLDDRLTDAIPLLLFLLEALPEDHPLRSLDPSLRQAHVLNAAKRLLLRETQRQPVLLVVENLHWIDPDSQALFEGLVESLPTARLLLLVNYRAEFQHGWGNKSYYTQLRLDPLRPASAEALLERLLGSAADLVPLKRLLIERTQGNPFFLEETVRTLVETDVLVGDRGAYRLVKPLPTIQVPASVQAVLAARIDRLPPEEKRLLQAAAVIGAHVSVPLLRAIAEVPPDGLQQNLTHLQAAEFLYERALFPDVTYTFTHALTHEVAYGSLLQEQRRALHARIVDAFEELYPDRLAEHTEWLAHHVARGEVWSKALSYFRPVGSGQVPLIMAGSFWWLGDHARALETAREDLRIASDFSHFPLQLQAYVRLGQIYHSLGEYPRAIECLRRNVASLDGELLREPFDLPAPPSVLSRAWLTWCLGECGEFAEATVLAAEARQIAEALEEPYSRILAAAALGVLHTAKAEPEAAIAPLEAALARARDRRLVVLVPLVAAPLGYAAALAGRVATGLAVLEQAVEQAAAMQFKANQALRLVWLGEARVLAGHPDLARALATRALALSEAQAERGHQAHALRLLGEIAAGDAHADAPAAEASYRQALALAEALGMRPLQARCHRGLGELYGRIGETERARPEMEAAIALRESMERPR
jgi:tetratricopeptide (TPR) repeat protein